MLAALPELLSVSLFTSAKFSPMEVNDSATFFPAAGIQTKFLYKTSFFIVLNKKAKLPATFSLENNTLVFVKYCLISNQKQGLISTDTRFLCLALD